MSGWWTTAFLVSWFAWAPLSCLFPGKIARGYTVRQFILVNLPGLVIVLGAAGSLILVLVKSYAT